MHRIDLELAFQAQRQARAAQGIAREPPLGGIGIEHAQHPFVHQLDDVMLIHGADAAQVAHA